MKVVLQRRERKAGATFALLLVCLLFAQSPLRAQEATSSSTNYTTSRLGEVRIDIHSLQPSRLLEALRSNVFTDVTVNIAGQPRTFRVSVSSRIVVLNGGELVYDGPDQSDPQNKIFMLLSEQRADITITLGDREYLITPTENVDDKNSAQKGQVVPGVTTFGAYNLIDQHELGKWIANNVPVGRSTETAPLKCGTDMRAEKKGAPAKDWDYSDMFIRTGYIGKRDLYLHAYGAINQDRFPTLVNNINNIFTHDDRFNDIRLVVIKHARGETTNQIIDGSNLLWNSNSGALLDSFIDKVTKEPAFKYNSNEYHMYLSDNKWDDALGRAYSPGNFSVAKYEVEVPYQLGYTTPLHEFSHNLGAQHTDDIYYDGWWYDDLMLTGDGGTYFRGARLTWHYNGTNRDRIHNRANTVSIKDEVLDGTYTPTVRDWNFSEDLVVVSDNTGNTSLTPAPLDTDKPFDDGGPDVSRSNRWKINVYKMKAPQQSSSNQTFLQVRITEADFDTFLYVLDENGNLISKDDDSGSPTGSGLFGYDHPKKSYLSGYFNADKYYYFIVGGYYNSTFSRGEIMNNGGSGNFELKIRYGWYTEGWLTPRNSNTRQGLELARMTIADAPDQSQMLMAKDGSLISVADFGINDKTIAEVAPQLSLNVYPNPVKDGVLHVQQDGLTTNDVYTLFNSEGKVVQEGKLQPADKNGLSIKLLPSAKGLLLLRIKSTTGGSVRTAKIIVE